LGLLFVKELDKNLTKNILKKNDREFFGFDQIGHVIQDLLGDLYEPEFTKFELEREVIEMIIESAVS
jgi:hypothetical protein